MCLLDVSIQQNEPNLLLIFVDASGLTVHSTDGITLWGG